MHIIFGDAIKEIPDSFTVLELDTFRQSDSDQKFTAYCVVEKLPLGEFFSLESFKKIHNDLIKFYKQREWTYCEHAIEGLLGKWSGELDTFYLNLLSRIEEYKKNPPPDDWDGSVLRS